MTDLDQIARLDAWLSVVDEVSYYELLAVDPLAGPDELRAAFKQFAVAFHPDSHVGADQGTLAKLRRLFQEGAEAYRVLGDPDLRVRYDVALSRGLVRLPPETVSHRPSARAPDHRPLDEICRSAGAKLSAQKAAKLIDAGDLAGAKRELERALEYDGGANPALEERLEDLAVALYAMGDPNA